MYKKYQIVQITKNSDESFSFIRKMSLVKDPNETIELADKEANWATTVTPKENIDLVEELSRDGAVLDQDCIDTIKNFYEPGIKSAWSEEVIQRYNESSQNQPLI